MFSASCVDFYNKSWCFADGRDIVVFYGKSVDFGKFLVLAELFSIERALMAAFFLQQICNYMPNVKRNCLTGFKIIFEFLKFYGAIRFGAASLFDRYFKIITVCVFYLDYVGCGNDCVQNQNYKNFLIKK